MKKLRVLLSILAFFAASVGVYATEYVFAPTYYENTNPATTTGCDTMLSSPPPCDGATLVACKNSGSSPTIWKMEVIGSPCVQVFRNQ